MPSIISLTLADTLLALPSHHGNANISHPHSLPRADLASLTQFPCPIDRHFARSDEHLAGTTRVDQPHEFQKLVQFDILAVEFKLKMLHCLSRSKFIAACR